MEMWWCQLQRVKHLQLQWRQQKATLTVLS